MMATRAHLACRLTMASRALGGSGRTTIQVGWRLGRRDFAGRAQLVVCADLPRHAPPDQTHGWDECEAWGIVCWGRLAPSLRRARRAPRLTPSATSLAGNSERTRASLTQMPFPRRGPSMCCFLVGAMDAPSHGRCAQRGNDLVQLCVVRTEPQGRQVCRGGSRRGCFSPGAARCVTCAGVADEEPID
jgi:hypothetical protein